MTQLNQQDDQLPPLGRCAQCNGEKADAPLLIGIGPRPTNVYLHSECRRFWIARQNSSNEQS
jgi:hypothetical protein